MPIILVAALMADVEFSCDALLKDNAYLAGAGEGLKSAPYQASEELQFFDQVRKTVLASLDIGELEEGALPAVFVRCARPRQQATVFEGAEKRTDLDLQNSKCWAGQLILAAPHGSSGWAVPLIDGTVDATVARLIRVGLGEVPLAVVYPQARQLSCHFDGALGDTASVRVELPANRRTVTIPEIVQVLQEQRVNCLLTPQVGPPGLWNDGDKYIPGEQAERLIQWIVTSELRSHFRPVIADIEQVTAVGRIDICLTDPDRVRGEPLHPAVIELKALRSRTSTNAPVSNRTNIAAVVSGHRQAKAYRKIKQATFGVLACYDMRLAKTDLNAECAVVKARRMYFDGAMECAILPIYGDTADAQHELAADA